MRTLGSLIGPGDRLDLAPGLVRAMTPGASLPRGRSALRGRCCPG